MKAASFAVACMALLSAPASAADWTFRLSFDKEAHAEPFSGRVYVFFSKLNLEPRKGPNWFRPEQFIAKDVEGWKPGDALKLSADTPGLLAYPKPLAEMKLDGYRAQAVARFNPWEREIGSGAGNGFSAVERITGESGELAFQIKEIVPKREFPQSDWSKLLRVRSALLSKFHGRDVHLRASVILPKSYPEQPKRRYPVIFVIPGFGGDHFMGATQKPVPENNARGVEFLRVILDASCPLGHHVFADSANNGPVGEALVKEFIPALDEKFRTIAQPTARFLTGHSSGGWSSLWLQVTYPETFGGTWSTAPDPVDFRDFQRINLYRDNENMYVDAKGEKRPLARRGDQVMLWYRGFAEMEHVLGHGGQLHSFEAAFSPRGQDGKPRLVWDRATGKVNTEVAKTWEPYDIRLVLERNWKTLGPKLTGKLHVHMGDLDTFYLEGATILLKQSLAKLGSDAVVEIHPGKNHGSVMTPELRNRIRREMTVKFLKSHADAVPKSR